jgi:hypothetical protein
MLAHHCSFLTRAVAPLLKSADPSDPWDPDDDDGFLNGGCHDGAYSALRMMIWTNLTAHSDCSGVLNLYPWSRKQDLVVQAVAL